MIDIKQLLNDKWLNRKQDLLQNSKMQAQ